MLNASYIASAAIARYHAQQDREELTALLLIADNHQVQRVLEIGTAAGGTAWAWSQLPSVDRVITVDAARTYEAEVVAQESAGKIVRVTGDSADRATYEAVIRQLDHQPADLVFIDGDHTDKAARNDWLTYGQLAGANGLVVFHDTQPAPQFPTVQVAGLWQSLASTRRTLELVSRTGYGPGTGILWVAGSKARLP